VPHCHAINIEANIIGMTTIYMREQELIHWIYLHCDTGTLSSWIPDGGYTPLVAWSSSRALVFGRCAFTVLRSTCSWWV